MTLLKYLINTVFKNDINNAMTKEGIEQAKERLAQALQGIKDLVKAKEGYDLVARFDLFDL
jgi:hypothetical protein